MRSVTYFQRMFALLLLLLTSIFITGLQAATPPAAEQTLENGNYEEFLSLEPCLNPASGDKCTQNCYSLAANSGDKSLYACVNRKILEQAEHPSSDGISNSLTNGSTENFVFDINGTALPSSLGTPLPVRGGLIIMLFEDSPETDVSRHGIPSLIGKMVNNLIAVNVGQAASGQANLFGLIAFGKPHPASRDNALVRSKITDDFIAFSKESSKLLGRRRSKPFVGSLVPELGEAIRSALESHHSYSNYACEIIIVTYSRQALAVSRSDNLTNHPLFEALRKCGVHLMASVQLKSAHVDLTKSVTTLGISGTISVDILKGETQYDWIYGGTPSIVNITEEDSGFIKLAFDSGASIWDSNSVFPSLFASVKTDSVGGIVAYDISKRMSLRYVCPKGVQPFTDFQVTTASISQTLSCSTDASNSSCDCVKGSLDVPIPLITINNTAIFPNQNPLYTVGSKLLISCRSLLRATLHSTLSLSTTVDWIGRAPGTFDGAVVINTRLLQFPSAPLTVFSADRGHHCVVCRGTDFSGYSDNKQCFTVGEEGSCQGVAQSLYKPVMNERVDIIFVIGSVSDKSILFKLLTLPWKINEVLRIDGIGRSRVDPHQMNGFHFVFLRTPLLEQYYTEAVGKFLSGCILFLAAPDIHDPSLCTNRSPGSPRSACSLIDHALKTVSFRHNSHRMMVYVEDMAVAGDEENGEAVLDTQKRLGERLSGQHIDLFGIVNNQTWSVGGQRAYVPTRDAHLDPTATSTGLLEKSLPAAVKRSDFRFQISDFRSDLAGKRLWQRCSSAWDGTQLSKSSAAMLSGILHKYKNQLQLCRSCSCASNGSAVCTSERDQAVCRCVYHPKLPDSDCTKTGGTGSSAGIGIALGGSLAAITCCLLVVMVLRRYRRRKQMEARWFLSQTMNSPYNLRNAMEHLALSMLTVGQPLEVLTERMLTIGERLSGGHFGDVHKGTLRIFSADGEEEMRTVAVKRLKPTCVDPSQHSALLEEYMRQKNVGFHPNIVDMLAGGMYRGAACMVMEYMNGGDLRSFLLKMRARMGLGDDDEEYCYSERITSALSAKDLLRLSMQAAKGLAFLASRKVVHRDVAARNVLVKCSADHDFPVVKIADLGLARYLLKEDIYRAQSRLPLPAKWMAVESLGAGIFSSQSDVWAYGVLLWEIVTLGSSPYPGLPTSAILSYVASGSRMPQPKHCSDEIYAIMSNCWRANPPERPCFAELAATLERMMEENADYLQVLQPSGYAADEHEVSSLQASSVMDVSNELQVHEQTAIAVTRNRDDIHSIAAQRRPSTPHSEDRYTSVPRNSASSY